MNTLTDITSTKDFLNLHGIQQEVSLRSITQDVGLYASIQLLDRAIFTMCCLIEDPSQFTDPIYRESISYLFEIKTQLSKAFLERASKDLEAQERDKAKLDVLSELKDIELK